MTANSEAAHLRSLRADLLDEFGSERLEETAFPVYLNSFPPASYLGWRRVAVARELLESAVPGHALDFGSGLGVMLPYLRSRFASVTACDLDLEITAFMVQRLGLSDIDLVSTTAAGSPEPYDAVVALDVLEHVEGLDAIYADLLSRTKPGGVWVISGPTENWLYRAARRVARTSGEGHVRTIHDVLDAVPAEMRRERAVRLPFGLPLFVVQRFRRA